MKTFFLIFFFLLFLKNILSIRWCAGTICDDYCNTCNLCNETLCTGNCRCPSTNIPGNIYKDQVPQFVLFSIMGPITSSNWDLTQFATHFLGNDMNDINGCKVRPTFFTTADQSDYNYIRYASSIGEVALHTMTGYTTELSSLVHFEAEISKSKELISEYSVINKSSRAPNLKYNAHYFTSLQKNGIQWDSSVKHNPKTTEGTSSTGMRYWPYTLQNGLAEKGLCEPLMCPTQQYDNLWEIHLTEIYNTTGGSYALIDPNITNYTETMDLYKLNFEHNYQLNRAPFGFYVTWNCYHSGVMWATESMVIQWVKNPKIVSETQALSFIKCPLVDAANPESICQTVKCNYPKASNDFTICKKNSSSSCPGTYPSIVSSICGDGTCQIGIEDCSCSDCSNCKGTWPGLIKFSMNKNESGELCGDIIFKNIEAQNANNYIISFEYCNSATVKTIWGGRSAQLIESPSEIDLFFNPNITIPNFFLTRIMRIGFSISSVTEYKIAGVCFTIDGLFYLESMLRFGIEFFDNKPTCGVNTCSVKCGNRACETGEDKYNCPIDCDPISCSGNITLINNVTAKIAVKENILIKLLLFIWLIILILE